jgi:hypothetical protein
MVDIQYVYSINSCCSAAEEQLLAIMLWHQEF